MIPSNNLRSEHGLYLTSKNVELMNVSMAVVYYQRKIQIFCTEGNNNTIN